MNTIDLLKEMGELGVKFKRSEIEPAIDYVSKMLSDKRVIYMTGENDERVISFFSVCYNYEPFYKKKTWDYLPHFPEGNIVYVEKIVSTGWNRKMRELFEIEILKHHPKFEHAVWHRWAKWGDRKTLTVRRVKEHV